METKGLLFIPDISGFTKFVNATEINHSRLIIQELLELLINANQIGLQVSEIEGDAILFYKYGDPPDLKELYNQVERMFCEFHQNLAAYEQSRFCWCGACKSAINLTLKVITHYGEYAGYNVKEFSKLIGKDVIVAHQLLKNDIEPHEYWLITQNLETTNEPEIFADWMTWNISSKQVEDGELPFRYTYITRLKEAINPQLPAQIDFSRMTKAFTIVNEYEADLVKLFHAAGDFKYRDKWMAGIKSVEQVAHYLPRVGMKCKCQTDDGELMISSSSFLSAEGKVEFTEAYEGKNVVTHYVLEKINDDRTKLTFTYYLQNSNVFSAFGFNLFKKGKVETEANTSFQRLHQFLRGYGSQ